MEAGNLLLMIGFLLMAALAIGVCVFFLQRYINPEPSPVEERLARIKAVQADADKMDPTQLRLSKMYTAEYSNENLGKILAKYDIVQSTKKLMQQAGMKMPIDKFVLFFWIAPVVVCFIIGIALGSPIISFAGFIVFFGSKAFLGFKKSMRYGKLTAQLPDALNLITSSLRAGHAFQSALGVISSDMPDPIAGEFAQLVRDINLGIPVKEAMDKMVTNVEINDIRMFVTAVQIQRESGGNLAEILDKLSYTIRERFKLKGQIAALTGQARLTGYVLGAAPIVLLIGLTIFMPAYLDKLYNSEMGRALLLFGGISQCIGFFIMKKIIDIRV